MRLAGGSASASVNWAKSGLRCASSNPHGTIFPLNTVTLGRMPPLEYDAHPGVRCPPGMRCQSCMWDSQAYADIFFDHKFHSIHPESITLHPARLAPQPRISIASTGLKYQNLMEYDCMRDSSKRWKKPDFPYIPYYHIPEVFISEGGKKRTSSGSFFSSNIVLCCLRRFFWYTIPFVEYDDL